MNALDNPIRRNGLPSWSTRISALGCPLVVLVLLLAAGCGSSRAPRGASHHWAYDNEHAAGPTAIRLQPDTLRRWTI